MWKKMTHLWLTILSLTAVPVAMAQFGPSTMPDTLRVPEQNVRQLTTYASGAQIYQCKPSAANPAAYEWTLKAPDAVLWNERGQKVGTHYAGPTWESYDGSKVVGQLIERAPAPESDDIPWLLLRGVSNRGNGAFSTTTYVQRVETVGGVAPMDGCVSSAAGAERSVDYAATYHFYSWNGDVR
jgi:hypothetical protein